MSPTLQRMINAAAMSMSRDRAEELCRNILQGFPGLDNELERTVYVRASIERRLRYFGLRIIGDPMSVARRILLAFNAGRAAA